MPFILKDGSEVADRRLGCIYSEDERRLGFPVMAMLDKPKKPRSYTWRCSTVLDQGREGSCVGHGCAHELISRPAECRGIDHDFAVKVYHFAQQKDDWPGGAYPGANPFYEGTSVAAGAKVLQTLGYIDNYYWANSLDEMVVGVGYAGPAVVGVDWHEGMFETDREGYIHMTGRRQGGHCVCITGVNVARKEFWGVNSWGRGWGIDGFFRISWSDMEKLMNNKGVVCFFKGRHLR